MIILSLQRLGINSPKYKAYCITKNRFQEIEYFKIIGITKNILIPIQITHKNRSRTLKIDRDTVRYLNQRSLNLIYDINSHFKLTRNTTTYINNEIVFPSKNIAEIALNQIIKTTSGVK